MLEKLELANEESAIANEQLRITNNFLENANHQLEETNSLLEHANAQLEMRTFELSAANDRITLQNKTLQELSAEKDEFLGIASHDLKNPLSGIQGLAELLMTSNNIEQKQVHLLGETMFKSSQRMFELIKNLLDINALERNGQQFTPTTFDFAPSVAFAVDTYNGRGAEKDITLHFEYPEQKMNIFADRLAAEQVLDNIISNAVKYSPKGKNVWVNIEEKTLEKEILISVKDEGPGLSSEDMKKLFGKFARLSARPTGGEHSTGLGLSIVKKMVEMMNGRVWCESELGKGATFFIALPMSSSNAS